MPFPELYPGRKSCKNDLTLDLTELTYKYHLRSDSGSNGPVAKESSPLFGRWPILVFPSLQHSGASIQPVRAAISSWQ